MANSIISSGLGSLSLPTLSSFEVKRWLRHNGTPQLSDLLAKATRNDTEGSLPQKLSGQPVALPLSTTTVEEPPGNGSDETKNGHRGASLPPRQLLTSPKPGGPSAVLQVLRIAIFFRGQAHH
ncbi:hypothetical protein MC885_012467 [Smutsia gigantea]|nr:hypothetical protein MC885_012467 [Smutsia gigantea]